MGQHKNTALRKAKVRELALQYYEKGNQSKCLKAVWRYKIYPIYPMCYNTFLSCMRESSKKIDDHSPTLFDTSDY